VSVDNRASSAKMETMDEAKERPALPDHLSVDPRSPHHVAAVFEHEVGIRLNGKERFDVEEYCISEGWVKVPAGKTVDRRGQPLSQARALLRYTLSWLWFVPALAAIAPFKLSAPQSVVIVAGWAAVWAVLSRFHPQRQFWHDALAGTRLIAANGANTPTP